jgi:hypothetical protein
MREVYPAPTTCATMRIAPAPQLLQTTDDRGPQTGITGPQSPVCRQLHSALRIPHSALIILPALCQLPAAPWSPVRCLLPPPTTRLTSFRLTANSYTRIT